LSLAATSSAFESFLKFRLHKNFFENLIKANMKTVLQKVEKSQIKDADLPEISARLKNIEMHIQPTQGIWSDIIVESFLDEGQMMLEFHNMEFKGSGKIQDDNGAVESISFISPITTC
jgi:hypothetical protein